MMDVVHKVSYFDGLFIEMVSVTVLTFLALCTQCSTSLALCSSLSVTEGRFVVICMGSGAL